MVASRINLECDKEMNRRAQVESGVFQNLIVAALLVCGVVIFSVGLIGEFNLNYDSNINTQKIEVLNKYNQINDTIGDFSNKIQGNEDSQPESTNIIDLIITAGYGTIKLMFTVPKILTEMAVGAVTGLGLPSEAIWLLSSLALVFIIFAAFAVIMKVRA